MIKADHTRTNASGTVKSCAVMTARINRPWPAPATAGSEITANYRSTTSFVQFLYAIVE